MLTFGCFGVSIFREIDRGYHWSIEKQLSVLEVFYGSFSGLHCSEVPRILSGIQTQGE